MRSADDPDFLSCLSGSERGIAKCGTLILFLSCLSGSEQMVTHGF